MLVRVGAHVPWRLWRDGLHFDHHTHRDGHSSPCIRMSDGHYCLLKDLGPVKGAKGMKHHEVIIDFSRRGLLEVLRRLISRKKPPR